MSSDLLFYILWGREIIHNWSHYLLQNSEMAEFTWIFLGVLSFGLSYWRIMRLPRFLVWFYLGYKLLYWNSNLEKRLFQELNKFI